jgi:hypothetical protein
MNNILIKTPDWLIRAISYSIVAVGFVIFGIGFLGVLKNYFSGYGDDSRCASWDYHGCSSEY